MLPDELILSTTPVDIYRKIMKKIINEGKLNKLMVVSLLQEVVRVQVLDLSVDVEDITLPKYYTSVVLF